MDPEEYRKKIELDIIDIIQKKLQNGQMETGRAREIAQLVLQKLHPPLTLEQIYEIVLSLDDHFIELASAVLPVAKRHEEEIKEIVASHAENLIKSGKLEEAHKALQEATNAQIKQGGTLQS